MQRPAERAAANGILKGFIPVSYTHLDVYKRQRMRKNRAHARLGMLALAAERELPPKKRLLRTLHLSLIHI